MADGPLASSRISDVSRASSALRSFSVNEPRISDEDSSSLLSSTKGILQLSKQVLKEFPKNAGKSVDKERFHDSQTCRLSKYSMKNSTSLDQTKQPCSPTHTFCVREEILSNSNDTRLEPKSKSLSSSASRNLMQSGQLISSIPQPDNTGPEIPLEHNALRKSNIQTANSSTDSEFLLLDEISSLISAIPWESSVLKSQFSLCKAGKTSSNVATLDSSLLPDSYKSILTDETLLHPAANRKIFVSPVFTYNSKLDLTLSSLPTTNKKNLDIEAPLQVKDEDYVTLRRGGVSSDHTIIPGRDSFKEKVIDAFSTGQNISKPDKPIFKEKNFKGPFRDSRERSLKSPARSLRSIGTEDSRKSLLDQVHYNYFDRMKKNSRKKTMQWLKDLLPNTGPYESQLTTLPTRTGSSQYSNKMYLDSNQEPKLHKSQPLEVRSSYENNLPEIGLTNTINHLEQLVDETLLIAQRVIDNEGSVNGASILDNASKFLKNSRVDITKYLNKASSPNNTHESLRESSEDCEPYESDEFETPGSDGNETMRNVTTNAVGQSMNESSWLSTGYISEQIKNDSLKFRSARSSEEFFEQQDINSINRGRYLPQRISNRLRNKFSKSHPPNFEMNIPTKSPYLSIDRFAQIPIYHGSVIEQEDLPLDIMDKLEDCYDQKSELTSLKPGDSRSCINNNLGSSSKKIDNFKVSRVQDLKIPKKLDNHSLCSLKDSNGDEIYLDGDKASKPSLPSNNIATMQNNPVFNSQNWDRLENKTHFKQMKSNGNRFKESIPTIVQKKQIIARDWSSRKKRPVAAVACFSTALIGILVGIYAGETPAIQYYIVDLNHYTILGNVLFFLGLAIPTFFVWPLPLLHGRKPYILGSMSIAMPLLFPQALAVGDIRSPYVVHWRIGLLLSRALMGFCLGFANMNFKSMLTDLFGASLQSSNPYQEHFDEFDVRRHGGGMGIWLGLWTWSTLGSIGIGFLIGAAIIESLPPSWGFYVSIIIIAFVMLLNVVCPELRQSAFKRSVADVVTRDLVSRKSIDGEIGLNIPKNGPKWWKEELYYGFSLSQKMLRQPGFLIMSLYVAWIYAQQVLIIVLVGALMSKDYHFRSPMVGLSVMAMPIGALLAVPFQKASLLSRTRRRLSVNDDSIFLKRKIHWSSHMLRRAIFVLCLPIFGLIYTLLSSGPPIPFIFPILAAGVIGFLSNLALAECNGIIMETFDTSDLQAGMIGQPRGLSGERTAMKRTNYSSFPRVCSAFAIFETFGYVFAAGTSGVSGILSRRLGQQAATGVMATILFILSILLLGTLVRYTEVQIIPDSKMEQMNNYHQARKASQLRREAGLDENEVPWRPVIIGNPFKSTRKICLLELGSLSRYSEIRMKNRLIDKTSLEARHPNRNAINFLEREIKRNIKKSASHCSRDSQRDDVLKQNASYRHKNMLNLKYDHQKGV